MMFCRKALGVLLVAHLGLFGAPGAADEPANEPSGGGGLVIDLDVMAGRGVDRRGGLSAGWDVELFTDDSARLAQAVLAGRELERESWVAGLFGSEVVLEQPDPAELQARGAVGLFQRPVRIGVVTAAGASADQGLPEVLVVGVLGVAVVGGGLVLWVLHQRRSRALVGED